MRTRWKYAALLACPVLLASAQTGTPGLSQSATAASAPEVLNFEDLVREALAVNPEVQAALHTITALEHRVSQAKAFPDPMLAIGWAGNATPFSIMAGDPSSYRGITISEQLPYPGKRRIQGAIASKEVEAAQADCEAIRRRVAADVGAAFDDYFYVTKAMQSTEENKRLLEKLSKIAEAQYSVGKSTQQDVLRSQIEISMLVQKLTELEEQRATVKASINSFLQRSPDAPLPPPADIHPAQIQYSLEELYAMAAENEPSILRAEKELDRGRLNVERAKKDEHPDLGISYMYQQRAAQPDMYGFTLNVNIPIFYKSKQRQAISEATEDVVSAERSRQNRQTEVRFELKRQYLAATASERLMDLYAKGIVPQASLALESSMAAYQVGKVDFLTLLANFTSVLNYETDYYRQVADHQTAIVRAESLTGTEIAVPPAHEQDTPGAALLREER